MKIAELQSKMIICSCSFSETGALCEEKLFPCYPEITWISKRYGYVTDGCQSLRIQTMPDIKDFIAEAFRKRLPILFIGATGIAVRLIAEHVKDKFIDSPVLVMDVKRKFVIPLLSGHVGGANELAVLIAERTDAVPVITTGTDVEGRFAIDVFAKRNGFSILNRDVVKHVAGDILGGHRLCIWVHPDVEFVKPPVTLEYVVETGDTVPDYADVVVLPDADLVRDTCDVRDDGDGCGGSGDVRDGGDGCIGSANIRGASVNYGGRNIRGDGGDGCGVSDSYINGVKNLQKLKNHLIEDPEKSPVVLVPKTYCVGIGCKHGKTFDEISAFLEENLSDEVRENMCAIASIDIKKHEIGLMELAQYHHIPFVTYTADELAAVPGEFSESEFVREKTGVSNVCERAAVKCAGEENTDCAGEGGVLICKKIAKDGMTVAVAKRKPKIVTWKTDAKEFLKDFQLCAIK